MGLRGWVKRLEQRHGMDEDPEAKVQPTPEERAERRARYERIIAREPLDMSPRRRKALDDLNESYRRRSEQRGA